MEIFDGKSYDNDRRSKRTAIDSATSSINTDMCCGCEACVQICPKQALTLVANHEGFRYPVFDKNKCVKCIKCEQVCPIRGKQDLLDNALDYYGAKHQNIDVRLESSAGGMFTYLIQEFKKVYPLGYISGVVYHDNFQAVKHVVSNSQDIINQMKGSKYIQSYKNSIYIQVKELLDEDKAVLFSGLPCEVDALYRVLNKKYNKLWTLDLICKGATSPRILSDYTQFLERKYHSKVIAMNMRYKWEKLDLWIPQFLYVRFKNNKRMLKEFYNTELGLAFKMLQRKNCKNCIYREKQHKSDFTIGDFHGADEKRDCFDRLGTSVIIVNSDRARRLWNNFEKNDITIEVLSQEDVYRDNRNVPDPRSSRLSEYLRTHNSIDAVRQCLGKKDKVKMYIPAKLLRKVTVVRRKWMKKI